MCLLEHVIAREVVPRGLDPAFDPRRRRGRAPRRRDGRLRQRRAHAVQRSVRAVRPIRSGVPFLRRSLALQLLEDVDRPALAHARGLVEEPVMGTARYAAMMIRTTSAL